MNESNDQRNSPNRIYRRVFWGNGFYLGLIEKRDVNTGERGAINARPVYVCVHVRTFYVRRYDADCCTDLDGKLGAVPKLSRRRWF